MGRRSRWLALTLALCFVVVLALLMNIQLRRAAVLNATATNPRNAVERFDNARGLVLASDGSVLARSVPTGAPPDIYRCRRVYPTGPLYSSVVEYSALPYGSAGAECTYDTFPGVHKGPPQTRGQLVETPGRTTDTLTLTVMPQLQRAGSLRPASRCRHSVRGQSPRPTFRTPWSSRGSRTRGWL